MIEISYDNYFNNYRTNSQGTIPEEFFTPCLQMAERYLQNALLGRLDRGAPEAVLPCLCHLAELYYEQMQCCGVSTEDNDGYRVSYDNNVLKDAFSQVLFLYFGDSGLLYRGIG